MDCVRLLTVHVCAHRVTVEYAVKKSAHIHTTETIALIPVNVTTMLLAATRLAIAIANLGSKDSSVIGLATVKHLG